MSVYAALAYCKKYSRVQTLNENHVTVCHDMKQYAGRDLH